MKHQIIGMEESNFHATFILPLPEFNFSSMFAITQNDGPKEKAQQDFGFRVRCQINNAVFNIAQTIPGRLAQVKQFTSSSPRHQEPTWVPRDTRDAVMHFSRYRPRPIRIYACPIISRIEVISRSKLGFSNLGRPNTNPLPKPYYISLISAFSSAKSLSHLRLYSSLKLNINFEYSSCLDNVTLIA